MAPLLQRNEILNSPQTHHPALVPIKESINQNYAQQYYFYCSLAK